MINRFNIRVYFILFSDDNTSVLLSDEIIRRKRYTKFPGGGLEFGEGLVDCAKREAVEELGQEIDVLGHLYTSDFFLQSAFRETDQIIAVYYAAKLISPQRFTSHTRKFQFTQEENDEESFRWIKIADLTSDEMSFPADKKLVEIILQFMATSAQEVNN